MANQFEDNATNALVLILKGRNKTKAKFIFDFLIKKWNKKIDFENLDEVKTREEFNLKNGKTTKPDIVLKFKSNIPDYKVEVKDKNAKLTSSEKDPTSRDVFLIPENYIYKKDIPIKNV